jgi:protein-S-isoprenylcysteine O-methyltransferase Ste14
MTSLVAGLWVISRIQVLSPLRLVVGSVCLGVSTTLFWWTYYVNRKKPLTLAYAPDRPVHIQTKGPYSFIRHPFYTSYLMSYVAASVLSGDWKMLLCTGAMALIYYQAALYEEGKFLSTPLAAKYRRYVWATDRFFPFWGLIRRSTPSIRGRAAKKV